MNKFLLAGILLLTANLSSAAMTDFDISCSVYTALVPAKDPVKMWNYNIEDEFRLKVQNGLASLAYGYGPGTRTVGQPIRWVPVFNNVPAKVGMTRWETTVSIPAPNGQLITIVLKQGSRANAGGHFIDGLFDLPFGFKLKDGTVITRFDAGFCFDSK